MSALSAVELRFREQASEPGAIARTGDDAPRREMRPCLGLGEACARLVGVLAAVIHPTDVRHPDLEHVGICTVQRKRS